MAEPDTKDLDALLGSLNGSAARFQTLWLWFVGATLYLAITALGTTHRALLLAESPNLTDLDSLVKQLPFYVTAPLSFINSQFYVLTPLFYVVFHSFVLLMLLPLAGTAVAFEERLRTTFPFQADQETYRARVENALFQQMLVGRKPVRANFEQIGVVTIGLAPIATLILMQLKFLPDHSFWTTWWHRILVVADLLLIAGASRDYFARSDVGKRPVPRLRTRMAASLTLIYVVLWLSFGEGQWAGENQVWRADFDGTANGVVFRLFPDRLILRNEIIVGNDRVEQAKSEIASRGGDFVPTIKLDGRNLQAAVLSSADLRGVSLRGAAMQGADLHRAQLRGAQLNEVQMQGADRSVAQLQGAQLNRVRLQGADLRGAQLQGADLQLAELQGADLSSAKLQGADLHHALLWGADLGRAQLQGSDLSDALLQGAQLRRSQLQGADLHDASLQGAALGGAEMADSNLNETFVFRTGMTEANVSTSAIRSVQSDRFKFSDGDDLNDDFNSQFLTPGDVDEWSSSAAEFAPEIEIAGRFARLKPNFQTADQDAADRRKWDGWAEALLALDPDGAQHRRWLAAFLGDLACAADGVPYVARGLLRNQSLRLAALGDQLNSVRARMKAARENPDACKGVVGFTENDWSALEAIKPVQDQNSAQSTTHSR